MKKTANAKSKKGTEVKEHQKISSFFNKLNIKKIENTNIKIKTKDETKSKPTTSTANLNSDVISDDDAFIVTSNGKYPEHGGNSTNSSPIKISNNIFKKKTPVKSVKKKVNSPKKDLKNNVINGNNSDNDFIDTKENKTVNSPFKHKNLKDISSNNVNSPETNGLVSSKSLSPNSKTIDSLFTTKELRKSTRVTNPPHSTPQNKRKILNSPDVIPSTPQEIAIKPQKKSKLCIESKFKDDCNIPDRIVKSPPKKKMRVSNTDENKTIINLSNISCDEFEKIHALSVDSSTSSNKSSELKTINDKEEAINDKIKETPTKPNNVLQSTTKFNVTPVKNITPSKNSPHKCDVTSFKITPSKSKRALFSKKEPVISTENIEVCKESIVKNNCKENKNELIDYYSNLPSSSEEKKAMEIDVSNFIVLKKTPKKSDEINSKSEENFDDLVFDDDWDDEINNIDVTNNLNLETWQYCRVLEINKDLYQNLIVKLQSIENKMETICILQGIWQCTKLAQGDIINIIASKSNDNIPYYINNNEGFLVYEPDFMISPTSIVGSQFCERKGILQEKFRGFDPENKIMIVGTLVHNLLEEVLKKKIYKPSLIEKRLIEILISKNMIMTSFSSQISINEIKNELLPFIPKIVNFIEKYVAVDNNKKVKKNKQTTNNSDDWTGSIYSIKDVEENIWCPQLGIKGKVDITVKIDQFENILPLELKTGRASMSLEHRGQVIMYIMMMNELGYNITSGLLLYLREEVMKEVTISHQVKRDLLMLRNDFAYYMKQKPKILSNSQDFKNTNSDTESNNSKSFISVMSESDPSYQLAVTELPKPINHHSACKKCPYAIICTAFLSREKTFEIPENHPIISVSKDCLKHLEQIHIDYFVHWTSLMTLENNYKPPVKELKDIWRLKPYQRELRCKSICYLKLSGDIIENDGVYMHTFVRATDKKNLKIIKENGLNNNFIVSGLCSGNYVIISSETRIAIASGFIKNISENTISVALERHLLERYSNKIFHIDTYESQQILNFSMTSIAALLEDSDRAKNLRELIINKKPSVIPSKIPTEVVTVIKSSKGGAIIKRLNKIQQRAVVNAIISKNYLLIKGMPGTGKTATIIALIQLLVILNKSILITSHTHSAVDNVCLRLLDCGIDFLRLGSENRVHPQLKHRTESVLTAHCKTVEELQDVYNKSNVIAVTCLAAGHPLFSQRQLDVCIVDESTQVLQSSVLKALLSTKTFVLIGDPDQLPPVVKNPEAVRRGMNESLFERLDNSLSTVTLSLQYRMNKIITDLANNVTYKGHLLCADDSIGYAVLRLPKLEKIQTLYSQEQWILSVLDPKIQSSVIVIDTGPTWNINYEEKITEDDMLLSEFQLAPQNVKEDEDRKCSNLFEAAIIVSLIQALKEGGVLFDAIGIIAPYRAQVELLKKKVSKLYENSETVEVNTVDQYQGRDKDVIIYSCTRSRDISKMKNNTGFEILEDKRRLTVAITRAKHKLIIIGDFITLKEYSPFNKLLNSLENNQKIFLNDPYNNFNWKKVSKRMDL